MSNLVKSDLIVDVCCGKGSMSFSTEIGTHIHGEGDVTEVFVSAEGLEDSKHVLLGDEAKRVLLELRHDITEDQVKVFSKPPTVPTGAILRSRGTNLRRGWAAIKQ